MDNLLDKIDFELIKKLNEEKRKLLESRPEMYAYQAEIDAAMERAGSRQNRMAVLGALMTAKCRELEQALNNLSLVLSPFQEKK